MEETFLYRTGRWTCVQGRKNLDMNIHYHVSVILVLLFCRCESYLCDEVFKDLSV